MGPGRDEPTSCTTVNAPSGGVRPPEFHGLKDASAPLNLKYTAQMRHHNNYIPSTHRPMTSLLVNLPVVTGPLTAVLYCIGIDAISESEYSTQLNSQDPQSVIGVEINGTASQLTARVIIIPAVDLDPINCS